MTAYSLSPLGTLEVYSLPSSCLAAGTHIKSRPCLLAVHRVASGVRTSITRIAPLALVGSGAADERHFGEAAADLSLLDAAKPSLDQA